MIFKVGGLIFTSKEDFLFLKAIENKLSEVVKLVDNKTIKIRDIFKEFKKINVKESYYNAREGLDGLFDIATIMLQYKGTRFNTDYKVACMFFDKINIIKYTSKDEKEEEEEIESEEEEEMESEEEEEMESEEESESESESD